MQRVNGINKRMKGCAIKYTRFTKTIRNMCWRNSLSAREAKDVRNYFDL